MRVGIQGADLSPGARRAPERTREGRLGTGCASSHDHPKAKVMRVRPQWPTWKMVRQADESPDEDGTRSVSRVHWARREGQPGSGSGPPNHVGFRQLSGGHAGFPRSHTSAPRFGTREGHGRGTSSLVRLCLLSPVSEALVPSAHAHISRESVCVHMCACCTCVRACVRACACVRARVCMWCACACVRWGREPPEAGPGRLTVRMALRALLILLASRAGAAPGPGE